MVTLTLEEWQRQSSLLLQARPTTTRIVTKYNVPNLEAPKYQKPPKKRKREAEGADGKDATTAPRIPKATLTLKTFDSESGVVLQFKTDRAADVGRLIAGLGRLGRHMAALPEKMEDVAMRDAPALTQADAGSTSAPVPATTTVAKPQEQQQQQHGAGGGGKKKKKGKK